MENQATAQLRCECGCVEGTLRKASPRHVNRVVCYCDDCQKFAACLGRTDLLDSSGGTDIVQVASSRLQFTSGQEQIRGVRLSDNGTYRWFANCCKTPLGNMVNIGMPAIGIPIAPFLAAGESLSARFGEPIGRIRGEYAVGTTGPPPSGIPLIVMARAAPKVLAWKILRKGRGNPFLSSDGRVVRYPVETAAAVASGWEPGADDG